jgi:UDP-glucuronate decarboxylase
MAWMIRKLIEDELMERTVLSEDLKNVASCQLPYQKMKGKTVLVTGATGLIGVSLVRSLLTIGKIKVLAFVRNEEKAKNIFKQTSSDNLKIVVGNVTQEIDISEQVDYIFHCASITTSKTMIEKPVETILTSVEGTKNVLNLAKEKNCQSVVYVSSMEMYGAFDDLDHEVRETDLGYVDPLKIRSNYPESKRLCENMCEAYFSEYDVPVKIARLAQTFGAGILPGENRVFAQFARSAINGQDIVLHSKGQSEGNYCYTSDCVTGLFTILLKGKNGEAYNVANPESHMRIVDMANMVADKIANNEIKVVFDIPDDNRYGYAADTKMKINSDKLQALGWQPEVGLEEAYRRMIKDMKEQNI